MRFQVDELHRRRVKWLVDNGQEGTKTFGERSGKPILSNCHGTVLWLFGAEKKFVDLMGQGNKVDGLVTFSKLGDLPEHAVFPRGFHQPGALDSYFMRAFYDNFCEEISEGEIQEGTIMRADGFVMDGDFKEPRSPIHSAVVYSLNPIRLIEQESTGDPFRVTSLKSFSNITRTRWYVYRK